MIRIAVLVVWVAMRVYNEGKTKATADMLEYDANFKAKTLSAVVLDLSRV
jgi:hypothetical protein